MSKKDAAAQRRAKCFAKLRESKWWKANVMRHSLGSCRPAQCQDTARVSPEMGNSPQMVFSHYRELVKPRDAETYWRIMPAAKAGKVVAFEAAVA